MDIEISSVVFGVLILLFFLTISSKVRVGMKDDYDKRAEEYYDRKTKHREEIFKPLAWLYGLTALFILGFWLWEAVG